jgi:hypothetical protein
VASPGGTQLPPEESHRVPSPGKAKTVGHDAGFSVVAVEPTTAPFHVERGDGWTIGANSVSELRDLAAEKLRQANQNLDDAQLAVDHWTAVLAAVKAQA